MCNIIPECVFPVFQDNWSIPYKREESLGRCLIAATNLARENLMEADDNCNKFIDRVMPEAFKSVHFATKF
jgi:ubiquitin carboxyl-terminal hydrolase 9/24